MAEGQLALLVETNHLEGGNLGARRVLLQLVLELQQFIATLKVAPCSFCRAICVDQFVRIADFSAKRLRMTFPSRRCLSVLNGTVAPTDAPSRTGQFFQDSVVRNDLTGMEL